MTTTNEKVRLNVALTGDEAVLASVRDALDGLDVVAIDDPGTAPDVIIATPDALEEGAPYAAVMRSLASEQYATLVVVADRETTGALRLAIRSAARAFFLMPEERGALLDLMLAEALDEERSAQRAMLNMSDPYDPDDAPSFDERSAPTGDARHVIEEDDVVQPDAPVVVDVPRGGALVVGIVRSGMRGVGDEASRFLIGLSTPMGHAVLLLDEQPARWARRNLRPGDVVMANVTGVEVSGNVVVGLANHVDVVTFDNERSRDERGEEVTS